VLKRRSKSSNAWNLLIRLVPPNVQADRQP
jgi:hypothetical protein